nr:hypothetical protein Iba_chr05eCG2160 [Ipomoea batatas]
MLPLKLNFSSCIYCASCSFYIASEAVDRCMLTSFSNWINCDACTPCRFNTASKAVDQYMLKSFSTCINYVGCRFYTASNSDLLFVVNTRVTSSASSIQHPQECVVSRVSSSDSSIRQSNTRKNASSAESTPASKDASSASSREELPDSSIQIYGSYFVT